MQEFNDKQGKANAAADPVAKLKEWLVNPPFRCTDEGIRVSQLFTAFTWSRGVTERDILLDPWLLAVTFALAVGWSLWATRCQGGSVAEQVLHFCL